MIVGPVRPLIYHDPPGTTIEAFGVLALWGVLYAGADIWISHRERREKASSNLKALTTLLTSNTVNLAARVAGRSYPWAAEAWAADLRYKSDGRGKKRPVPVWHRPFKALGFLLFTGPKMRVLKWTWTAESMLCRFGRWLLLCEMAADVTIGALHVSTVALLTDEAGLGFWPAVGIATAVALYAVHGVLRLRKRGYAAAREEE